MAWLRVCLIGLIAALALLLGACGNREPEARAAFIALLQSRSRGPPPADRSPCRP